MDVTHSTVEETERETQPGAVATEPELPHHPGPREYVRVAVILALATAAEVALYYLKSIPHPLLVALLLFFAVMRHGDTRNKLGVFWDAQ